VVGDYGNMELQVKDIRKKYGKKEALKGVSFTLHKGIYGLLGPNGAGKSTMMGILTGNLKATDGTVLWNGANIQKDAVAYRKILGYVPQQQAMYPDFTAKVFLDYMAALKGLNKKQAEERIPYVLNMVDLYDVNENKIKTFSGGMKQRLLIAQGVLADPEFLVMDEPTTGLDPKQRTVIRDLIAEISQNKVILISTHIVSDIENIANEIMLLKEGCLIKAGKKEEMIKEIPQKINEHTEPDGSLKTDLEKIYLYYFGDAYEKMHIL